MRITNHEIVALSFLILTIGGVDGSRGSSTPVNVEDPYLFLGHLSLRNGGGETDALTAAPTSAPTTVDSSIQCPTGLYNATVYLSGDCTKAGICDHGNLQPTTIVECDVAAGEIYNVDCDVNTSGFLGCCTSEESVTCPTPSPTSSPSALPSKPPSKAPTSSPTTSPTATPTVSPTQSPTKAPTNSEQAGYEASMTTVNDDDAWVWTRDYSTCNRRRLEEGSATTSTKKKGVRGASHRRAQTSGETGDDAQQGDGDFDSNEIKTSFRDDEEGVGDDIGRDQNDPFEYVPPGYDDIEYDAITDKSKEFKTSEREYDDEFDDVEGDKEDKNKNNARTCVPAVLPVARQSAAMTTTQICSSRASPFGGPVTVATVNGRTVPESSGICSSHINPNTVWAHNDYSNHHSLFAISTINGSVRRYPIANGKNFDYEDIACGPGPKSGRGYIYVGDIGDNYARRTKWWNPVTIYRVQEPNLKTLEETSLTKWDKLELTFTDGPHNCEAMMIDPVSQRIFILTKSSGTIWVTPQQWGAGSTSMVLQKVGRIKKMTGPLTGMDITPDGKELVVKFYNSIHYFCMGTRQYSDPSNAWRDVVNVLQNNDGISVPYKEEPQGEAVCFGQNFGAGLFTLSEAKGSSEFPLIHYERL